MSIFGYSIMLKDKPISFYAFNIRRIHMTNSRLIVGAIAANSTSLIGSPEAANKDVSGCYFLFDLVMAICSDK